MSEFAKRIAALRGASNKTEFADAVGIARTALVAYEIKKGKKWRQPNAEVLIKLGNFAARQRRYEDATWFWAKAGLDRDAAAKTFEIAAGLVSSARDELCAVPPSGRIGDVADLRPIRFPVSMLPNPPFAKYVRLSDDFYAPLFHSGDIVVVDESETDLRKLEGAAVVFYRKPSREGFTMVTVDAQTKRRKSEDLGPTRREGIFVAWALRSAAGDNPADASIKTIIAAVPSRLGALLREHLEERESEGDGAVVLGAVVAWIPAKRLSHGAAGEKAK